MRSNHGRWLLLTGLLPVLSSLARSEPSRCDTRGDPLPHSVRFRLGTGRFRHAGTVNKLVWLPDGKTLVSASYDDPARLWCVGDGTELRRLNKEGSICGLAITRDGRLMAWGDGGVHLANPATGKEVRLLPDIPFSGAGRLNFSSDGKRLAACCLVGFRTRLYAVDSGKLLREFTNGSAGECVFSPDGKSLVIGTEKGILCVDVTTEAKSRTLPTKDGYVFSPVFSPDGKRLAGADLNGRIWIWSWPEGKLLHCLRCPGAHIREITFSPDGKTLATAGDQGHGLRIWEVASGKQRYHLPAYENQINAVAFSPDGSLLASGGDNRCISLWDMRSAKEPQLLTKGNRRFTAVTSTPDGKRLATAERDGSLVLWDAYDGREVRRLESWDRTAVKLTISPDGKWLVGCAEIGPIGLWNLATGRRQPSPRGIPATIGCAAFSPDSASVALGDDGGNVHVCAVPTGAKLRTIRREPPQEQMPSPEHFEVRTLDWSADGCALAIGYWDGGFALYDPLHGRKPRRGAVPKGGNVSTFSADGRLLAITSGDSRIRIYETATGQEIQRTSPLRLRILCMAFSADGRTLALGGGSSLELHYYNRYWGIGPRSPGEAAYSIRLWDVVENKELQRLAGHVLQVESLTFTPDGARLISGSADATPLCWDVATWTRRSAKVGVDGRRSHLSELWTELASRDAVRGQKAVGELIRSTHSALSLLTDKLTPAPPIRQERIPALIADLDNDEFARREKATQELLAIGETTVPALRQALKNKPSLEVRKRIELLLETIEAPDMPPQQLRTIRALQVLETIGTAEARRLLESLTKGAKEAMLTRQAKESLQRLDRRSR